MAEFLNVRRLMRLFFYIACVRGKKLWKGVPLTCFKTYWDHNDWNQIKKNHSLKITLNLSFWLREYKQFLGNPNLVITKPSKRVKTLSNHHMINDHCCMSVSKEREEAGRGGKGKANSYREKTCEDDQLSFLPSLILSQYPRRVSDAWK